MKIQRNSPITEESNDVLDEQDFQSAERIPETKEMRKLRHVAMEAIIFSAFALLVSGWPIYSQFLAPVLGYGPSASQSSSANPALSTGSPGAQGMSAYDLWVALGNAGSVQDFLNALIGEPGEPGEDGEDGQIIYRGSTGLTGPSGKSAYQLWLDSGNKGSQSDFLADLIGPMGFTGPPGVAGHDGQAGVAGLSAYELWLAIGNSGTESEFISSLVGPAGAVGAAGLAGETGAAGLSAYQIWLGNGHQGTTQDFLNSLKGEQGPQGPKGDPGESEVGIFGYFYDLTDQQLDQISPVPKALTFSNAPADDSGVNLSGQNTNSSRIEFTKTGWYAINYSIVFENTHKHLQTAEVWFAEGGVNLEDSANRFTLTDHAQTVVTGSYFYYCSDPDAYLEVIWYTSASDLITIKANPAANGQPAMPSVRLTAHRVDD